MKVSIIIINYNDKLHVSRAIESAINQSYKDVEVIVVDDGSDEETREIYEKYEGQINLIQLEREDPHARTVPQALNAGIGASTGEYIAVLGSDNYYDTKFVESLMKYRPADVLFCNWQIIGLQDYKVDIEKVWNFAHPILQNYLQFQHLDHQACLIRRDYQMKVGLYDERFPRSQDCDMLVRLILANGKWQHIQERLFFFEKHEEDQTKTYASVYGKTLWTLKNNINIQWLLGMLKDPLLICSYYKGILDFISDDKWKDDFDKSDFKKLLEEHNKILSGEMKEKVLV
jgi:glycosyltransferase involved in cell wall biosynthesis